MILVICGEGKGKTTAALGQCLRAKGRGNKILWTSFLKNYDSGEFLGEMPFDLLRGEPVEKFIIQMTDSEKKAVADEHRQRLYQILEKSSDYRMLVLDEIFGALETGMIGQEDLENFLSNTPDQKWILLTGRRCPEWIRNIADYVSEIQSVKHPFDDGLGAVEGIEY